MTLVSVASVKGSPGATTVACLVAAAWPPGRRVVLVEADPSGGDLAGRFRLPTRRGVSSFASASRRLEGIEAIDAHVQRLPGGLEVMVRATPGDLDDERLAVSAVLLSAASGPGAPWDVVVDVGRLLPGELGVAPWLEESAVLLVVIRREAACILQVRDRVPTLRSRCKGRIGLVMIGGGTFGRREIERFAGLPVVAELPDEPAAAQIAGGRPGGTRRLSRSLLVVSSQRLARALTGDTSDDWRPVPSRGHGADRAGAAEPEGDASDAGIRQQAKVSAFPIRLAKGVGNRVRKWFESGATDHRAGATDQVLGASDHRAGATDQVPNSACESRQLEVLQ